MSFFLFLFLVLPSATLFIVGASNFLIKSFGLNSREPVSRTLYLRELTCPPHHLLEGSNKNNVFVEEFNTLFEFVSNGLDFAVMKYVDEDVPILSKQEQKHAVLHINQMKQRKEEGESAGRWQWYCHLGDLLFNRCGASLGRSLVLNSEASTWAWFYYPVALPFVKDSLLNLFIFHGMEEVEHGALTVQSLRRKANPIVSLAAFPISVLFNVIFLLSPPIMVLLFHPLLLFYPSTYVNLLKYYLTFLPAFLITSWSLVWHGLLMFHESQSRYDQMIQALDKEMKARGITYNVVEKETYTLA